MKRIVGVIPARWQSTRFPGKMLAPLCGKPLLHWVVQRVRQARLLDAVVVATDDRRIVESVRGLGADVVMTRADHPSGTDRVAEAAERYEAEVVVNIQGDEPLIDPGLVDALAEALAAGGGWDMATAAEPILNEAETRLPSVVKVVFDRDHRALYFSRSVIPHVREKDSGEAGQEPLHWRHIGIYAYQRDFLRRFVKTPPCAMEEAEKLEQLRALYLGGRMKVLRAEAVGPGVDTPADVGRAERALREAGLA